MQRVLEIDFLLDLNNVQIKRHTVLQTVTSMNILIVGFGRKKMNSIKVILIIFML